MADVCIVGSGPSGQAVARTLLPSSAKILVVEAGQRDADRWGRRFASTAMPSIGRQYPNAGHQVSIRLGGTSDRWAIRLDPNDRSGSGIRVHRLDAVDFQPRPTPGADGWPIDLQELEPYYGQAEAMFGLTAVDDTVPEPTTNDPRLETRVFWAVDGQPFLVPELEGPDVVAGCAVTSLVADRSGRITTAHAVQRDGTPVRISADVFVLALGAVQTTRLLLDSPWSECRSVANSSGLLGRFLTDHPQLILGQLVFDGPTGPDELLALAPTVEAEGCLRWPNLVTSAQRSLSPDIARLATTLLPVHTIPRAQALRNWLPTRQGTRTGAQNAAGALVEDARSRSLRPSSLRHVPSILVGLDEIGFGVWDQLNRNRERSWSVESPHWGSTVGGSDGGGFQIFAIAEQLPDPENRIVLSSQPNSLGGRRAQIRWRWSADDRRRAEKAAEDVREMLADLNVGRVVPRTGRAAIHKINSHHAAGTARMSHSPADGVVNPDLRAHDHPNLYIVGSAVFNTAGFANPTLTDVALGIRLGEHLGGGRCRAFD